MNKPKLTLPDVERAISNFNPAQQKELLAKLPAILEIKPADIALPEMAKSAFDFWNNDEDAAYDTL